MAKTSKIGPQSVIYQVSRDELKELIYSAVKDAVTSVTTASEDDNTPTGLLTKKEVMERLHVTAMTLHRWNKSGYLPMKHVGRKVYYFVKDVDALAASNNKKQ